MNHKDCYTCLNAKTGIRTCGMTPADNADCSGWQVDGCKGCIHWSKDDTDAPCEYCTSTFENGVADYYRFDYGKPEDTVNHPSHYTQGNIECIDAMIAAYGKEAVASYCKINCFKYLWRTDLKNGLEDLEKAEWYLHKLIELRKELAND